MIKWESFCKLISCSFSLNHTFPGLWYRAQTMLVSFDIGTYPILYISHVLITVRYFDSLIMFSKVRLLNLFFIMGASVQRIALIQSAAIQMI